MDPLNVVSASSFSDDKKTRRPCSVWLMSTAEALLFFTAVVLLVALALL